MVDGDVSFVLKVEEVTAKTQENKRNYNNFVALKLAFLQQRVTIKLYLTRYFQIHGLSDQADQSAAKSAELLVRAVACKLSEPARSPFLPPDSLKVLALSAFHPGVSEHNLRFDLNALEAAIHVETFGDPEVSVKRNPRNHSLIVRWGPVSGSQLFHTTGTTQLMGVRASPARQLEALADLLTRHPHVVVPAAGKVRRRGLPRQPTKVGHADLSAALGKRSRGPACNQQRPVKRLASVPAVPRGPGDPFTLTRRFLVAPPVVEARVDIGGDSCDAGALGALGGDGGGDAGNEEGDDLCALVSLLQDDALTEDLCRLVAQASEPSTIPGDDLCAEPCASWGTVSDDFPGIFEFESPCA
mmetsp:Transcript_25975/g.59876  ORF Transcript_25975/g.59876 Transcript_25975/m.59876 type:complete len:357 (-) Transcript_25975:285-1355(-)